MITDSANLPLCVAQIQYFDIICITQLHLALLVSDCFASSKIWRRYSSTISLPPTTSCGFLDLSHSQRINCIWSQWSEKILTSGTAMSSQMRHGSKRTLQILNYISLREGLNKWEFFMNKKHSQRKGTNTQRSICHWGSNVWVGCSYWGACSFFKRQRSPVSHVQLTKWWKTKHLLRSWVKLKRKSVKWNTWKLPRIISCRDK